jgi:RND family efflux transporter MFP subunit
MAHFERKGALVLGLAAVLALGAVACRSSDAATGEPGGGGGQPAMPVRTLRLAPKTLSDFDEYLASLTSRRSITLYPQVNGYVREIRVKPGQTVQNGAVLITIDPGQQAATLRALRASLETKKANLAYAIQNDESSRELVNAGVLGQLDYQQRRSQRLSAEADLKAAEEQMQAQSDLLRFYTIVAPSDGVVGDVPVKIGDYVSPSSRLTSVDQDKLIEAYVYVPITKANAIKPDTTIQLLGDGAKVVCEEKPSFIAPQVSVDTQTVLVKTVCPNADNLRAAQVLRARVVWGRHPGVTVPVDAVVRLSGQYFAYVVDRSGKGPVVHQQPIEVASILDNDFIVTKGLEPGTEIAISNVQKIHDGAPVAPVDAASAASGSSGSPSAPPDSSSSQR